MNKYRQYQIICRFLSYGHEKNTETVPKLSTKQWQRLMQSGSEQLIIPAIYSSLSDKGLLRSLPEDIQKYIKTIFLLNEQRNIDLQRQLLHLINILNVKNIPVVLLKGVASINTNTYIHHSDRIMRDIDIFIDKKYIPEAVKVMFENNYRYLFLENQSTPPPSSPHPNPIQELYDLGYGHHHHLLPFIHPEFITAIEIHYKIVPSLSKKTLFTAKDTVDELEKASKLNAFTTLSVENRLLHCFYHSQIINKNSYCGKLDIQNLYEFSRIINSNYKYINWQKLHHKLIQNGLDHQFNAYLKLAEHYLNLALPSIYQASVLSNLIVIQHFLVVRVPAMGSMYSFIIFALLKVYRQFSLIRVSNKFADCHLGIAYLKQMQASLKIVTNINWMKLTWNQFRNNLKL